MNSTLNIIAEFSRKRVLVIGDSIVDIYVSGESKRLSPEAPVPIVDVSDEKLVAGGASNTAVNLRQLLADVTLYSVIGRDENGRRLLELLKAQDIHCHGVISLPERETIVKTRVLAGRQVLVRYDSGTCSPIRTSEENGLIELLKAEGPGFDAIIVSDYSKGVLTDNLINTLARLRRVYGTFVAVDSKRLRSFASIQPSLVKPNYPEAIELIGTNAQGLNRVSQISQAGEKLYSKTRARTSAVTLDSDGVVIFEGARHRHSAPATRISTPSSCGAGDTFISAFVLSMISGAQLKIAAEIAQTASSVVVSKTETAWCSAAELRLPFMHRTKRISSNDELRELCHAYREANRTIVFTNGCFDILHSGHVGYLNAARAQGDVLIVGVNTDDSIGRLKGENRPINSIHDRIAVLAGLGSVDHVVEFGDVFDDTPSSLIEIIQPQIFAKGDDYSENELPEAAVVKHYGGRIILLPTTPGKSTTGIIQKIGFPNIAGDVALH